MSFETLMEAMEQATWVTPFAALLWGLASVGLSGCHLSSVPLLVTFLGRINGQTLSAARLSALVTVGVSFSLLVVAGVTFALGRIMGDLWGVGPWIMIALLLLGGLNLLGVLQLPSIGGLDASKVSAGPRGALLSGGVLGVTLGPCTFSFFAPVLALVGTEGHPLIIASSIGAFVVGHLGLTWGLGVGGAALGGQLAKGARWAEGLKILVGVLAIGIAVNLIITAP